jgi:hypothetical protein
MSIVSLIDSRIDKLQQVATHCQNKRIELGQVRSLNLHSNLLVQLEPSLVGLFTSLVKLDVSSNKVVRLNHVCS